ncbi:MAG: endonuclease/exonuclease/phosphatase family protein [Actinomycetota bacterium]
MTTRGRDRSALSTALRGLTGGAGFLIVGLTFGALLGDLWWPLDLLTSFYPQFAVLLAVLGVLHLALRSPGSGAVMLAVALINLSIVAPYLVGGGPTAAADAPRLSVLSFNVGVSNPMRLEVARYVAEERPDLLFVLESSFEWEAALAAAGPPMSTVAIVPAGQVAGITVMADPRLLARTLEVGFAGPGEAAAVEVSLEGRRIVVLAIHPPSPTSGARAARRDAILAAAGDWVASVDAPVLVVGDCNTTPWSHAFRALQVRGGLFDTARVAGIQPSWPSGWGPAMIPIDQALHTEGLALVERHTGPSLGSAHRPLLVTVAATG